MTAILKRSKQFCARKNRSRCCAQKPVRNLLLKSVIAFGRYHGHTHTHTNEHSSFNPKKEDINNKTLRVRSARALVKRGMLLSIEDLDTSSRISRVVSYQLPGPASQLPLVELDSGETFVKSTDVSTPSDPQSREH